MTRYFESPLLLVLRVRSRLAALVCATVCCPRTRSLRVLQSSLPQHKRRCRSFSHRHNQLSIVRRSITRSGALLIATVCRFRTRSLRVSQSSRAMSSHGPQRSLPSRCPPTVAVAACYRAHRSLRWRHHSLLVSHAWVHLSRVASQIRCSLRIVAAWNF